MYDQIFPFALTSLKDVLISVCTIEWFVISLKIETLKCIKMAGQFPMFAETYAKYKIKWCIDKKRQG